MVPAFKFIVLPPLIFVVVPPAMFNWLPALMWTASLAFIKALAPVLCMLTSWSASMLTSFSLTRSIKFPACILISFSAWKFILVLRKLMFLSLYTSICPCLSMLIHALPLWLIMYTNSSVSCIKNCAPLALRSRMS